VDESADQPDNILAYKKAAAYRTVLLADAEGRDIVDAAVMT
jgi:hypothetical protein